MTWTGQDVATLITAGAAVYITLSQYRAARRAKQAEAEREEIKHELWEQRVLQEGTHALVNGGMMIQKRSLSEVTAAKAAITKDPKDVEAARVASKDYLEHVEKHHAEEKAREKMRASHVEQRGSSIVMS